MQERFNLEYLNTFVTAAETGKLNITAEMVYRSPSSVSTQIKNLEKQVGAPLFIRNKEALSLTKSGEILYQYAQKILELNDSAFNIIHNSDWKGALTFGVPTDYTQLFLTSIYPRLQEKYPDFHFTTVCSRSREIRKQIEEGKINIAIVAMEPQYTDDIFLWEEPLHWVCSKNFIHKPDSRLPVALFSNNCIVNNHSLYCLKKTNVDFQIVFTSTVLDNIADCVKSGVAVSLLPESLITDAFSTLSEDFITCPFTLKFGLTWGENADEAMLKEITEIVTLSLKKYPC